MTICPHGESGRFCCGYVDRGIPCPYRESPVVRYVPAELFGSCPLGELEEDCCGDFTDCARGLRPDASVDA